MFLPTIRYVVAGMVVVVDVVVEMVTVKMVVVKVMVVVEVVLCGSSKETMGCATRCIFVGCSVWGAPVGLLAHIARHTQVQGVFKEQWSS